MFGTITAYVLHSCLTFEGFWHFLSSAHVLHFAHEKNMVQWVCVWFRRFVLMSRLQVILQELARSIHSCKSVCMAHAKMHSSTVPHFMYSCQKSDACAFTFSILQTSHTRRCIMGADSHARVHSTHMRRTTHPTGPEHCFCLHRSTTSCCAYRSSRCACPLVRIRALTCLGRSRRQGSLSRRPPRAAAAPPPPASAHPSPRGKRRSRRPALGTTVARAHDGGPAAGRHGLERVSI